MKVPKEAVRRQIIELIPGCMNVMMLGCSMGWTPNAIYFLMLGEEVSATYSQCALVAAFFDFGKMVFALPSGILIDKYGRKTITISVAVLHILAWLAISWGTSIIMIYTGRFIAGLATAMLDATSLTLVGEIASPEIRGQLTGIHNTFVVVGMLLPSIINAKFHSYKSLTWGMTILSIISLLPMYWMLETPSYLISAGKLEKAKNVLHQIRPGYQENEVNEEFEKLDIYIREEKIRKSQLGWMQFIKVKSIRKPLIIGSLLNFSTSMTGAGVPTGEYVTVIFPSNDYIPAQFYPLIGQILSFLLVIITPLYIDRFRRRTIFLFGAITMTAANGISAIGEYFVEHQNLTSVQWIFLLGNVIAGICFFTALMPMMTALKSEIYPQAVKGFGASLAVLSQSLAASIVHQLLFFKGHCNLYLMYVIFSTSALFLCLLVNYVLPESCGVNLADLQMKFKEKTSANEVEVNDVERMLRE